MNKKNILTITFIALLMLLTLIVNKVESVMAPNTLDVIGIFDSYEYEQVNTIIVTHIYIIVNGEVFHSKLAPNCRFYDTKDNNINFEQLIKHYIKRYIKFTLIEIPNGSMIVKCKVI